MIQIQSNLSLSEVAALPRTTRWRYQKRGYVRNRVPVGCSPERFGTVSLAVILNEIGIAIKSESFREFPRWLTDDDLIQECVLALFLKSADANFQFPGWRARVAQNKLRDLAKKKREDSLADQPFYLLEKM